jgi:pimeloyl-ACP methyl ester carboxylesterase
MMYNVSHLCAAAGPAGPKPWDLIPKVKCPLFVAWGDTDPFTPVDGPVGK